MVITGDRIIIWLGEDKMYYMLLATDMSIYIYIFKVIVDHVVGHYEQ